jgi:hypothetical protein
MPLNRPSPGFQKHGLDSITARTAYRDLVPDRDATRARRLALFRHHDRHDRAVPCPTLTRCARYAKATARLAVARRAKAGR